MIRGASLRGAPRSIYGALAALVLAAPAAAGAREEVESYLSASARMTALGLQTVAAQPSDRATVSGAVELSFAFRPARRIELFVRLAGSPEDAAFPANFGPLAGTAGATLSGVADGIGVDGTALSRGPLAVLEAGAHLQLPAGDRTLHLRIGALEPRDVFADFPEEPETHFLNDVFDDPPAVSWITTRDSGAVGAHAWMEFGENADWRVDAGWFGSAGDVVAGGSFHFQVARLTELDALPVRMAAHVQVDTRPKGASLAAGANLHVRIAPAVSLFAWGTGRFFDRSEAEGDPNPVESDFGAGLLLHGPFAARPNDVFGVAAALIRSDLSRWAPRFSGVPHHHEGVLEAFYRFGFQDGRLQVTPLLQFVVNPGAGGFVQDEFLFLFGVRFHVEF